MEANSKTSYRMEIGESCTINNHHPTALAVHLSSAGGSTINVVLPPTGAVTVVSQGDITSFEVDVMGGEPLGPRALD
jgi:hypothetical protein